MKQKQTKIAASTMEAEYTALSIALRAEIHFLDVIRCVISSFRVSTVSLQNHCSRGQSGALKLANMEPGRQTPRSKFYAIKYHCYT
jgi:hypothetical protein